MTDEFTTSATARLARLEAQKREIDRKLTALRRRKSADARKADAHRKILVGAAVLAAVEKGGHEGRKWLSGVLRDTLSDRDQTAVADLLLPVAEKAEEAVQ